MSYFLSLFIALSFGFGAVVYKIWYAERKQRKAALKLIAISDPAAIPVSEQLLMGDPLVANNNPVAVPEPGNLLAPLPISE